MCNVVPSGGEGVGGGPHADNQQGGTSEQTAWPATSNEDAKAPSVKLEFWIVNFLICLFILFHFWHGASRRNRENLHRCERKDQQILFFPDCVYFSFVCFGPSLPSIIIIIHIVVPAGLQTSPSVESFATPLVLSTSFCLIHGRSGLIWDGVDGSPMPVWLGLLCIFRHVQRGHDWWRFDAIWQTGGSSPTASQAEGRSLQVNLCFLPADRVQRPPDRLGLGNVHKSHLVDSSAFSSRFSPHLAR